MKRILAIVLCVVVPTVMIAAQSGYNVTYGGSMTDSTSLGRFQPFIPAIYYVGLSATTRIPKLVPLVIFTEVAFKSVAYKLSD